MKKIKILIVAAGMALCVALTGCGGEEGGGGSDGISIDGGAIAQRLVEEVAFEDQLTQVDEETALALYGLSSDQVASAFVYVGTGATAEEVAVIEGTNESGVEAIKKQVDERLAGQMEDYGDYKPAEVPKLEDPLLETRGNFVILCVSGDNGTAEAIVEEMAK